MAETYTHAGLIIKAETTGRVLLVQRFPYHADDDGVHGRWEYPGGAIEEGEDPFEAAKREFFEETGLHLPEKHQVREELPNDNYIGFVVAVPEESWTTDAVLLDFETMGIGWFDPEEMAETEELLREVIYENDEFELVAEAGVKSGPGLPWNRVAMGDNPFSMKENPFIPAATPPAGGDNTTDEQMQDQQPQSNPTGQSVSTDKPMMTTAGSDNPYDLGWEAGWSGEGFDLGRLVGITPDDDLWQQGYEDGLADRRKAQSIPVLSPEGDMIGSRPPMLAAKTSSYYVVDENLRPVSRPGNPSLLWTERDLFVHQVTARGLRPLLSTRWKAVHASRFGEPARDHIVPVDGGLFRAVVASVQNRHPELPLTTVNKVALDELMKGPETDEEDLPDYKVDDEMAGLLIDSTVAQDAQGDPQMPGSEPGADPMGANDPMDPNAQPGGSNAFSQPDSSGTGGTGLYGDRQAEDVEVRVCPFCGSGNVIGRSDGSIECGFENKIFQVILMPSHPFSPMFYPDGTETGLNAGTVSAGGEMEGGGIETPKDNPFAKKDDKGENPFAKKDEGEDSDGGGNPFAKKDDSSDSSSDDSKKKDTKNPFAKGGRFRRRREPAMIDVHGMRMTREDYETLFGVVNGHD